MKYKYFVLDKENNVTIKTTKSFDTLYKTCGYRKNTDFNILHKWDNIDLNDKQLSVSLWGKLIGKRNNVNDADNLKYIINKTIYGPVVFVFTYDENTLSDVNMSTWNEFTETYLKCVSKHVVNLIIHLMMKLMVQTAKIIIVMLNVKRNIYKSRMN